jgi:hypothetical protein
MLVQVSPLLMKAISLNKTTPPLSNNFEIEIIKYTPGGLFSQLEI